jgi:hypothetical protein
MKEMTDLFGAVKHDLAASGLKAKLREDTLKLHDGLLHADLFVQGQRLGGLGVDPAQSPVAQALTLATQVQDLVLEGLRDSAGHQVVWPRCLSDHGHPMQPVMREDSPVWTCPHAPQLICCIGDYDPSRLQAT